MARGDLADDLAEAALAACRLLRDPSLQGVHMPAALRCYPNDRPLMFEPDTYQERATAWAYQTFEGHTPWRDPMERNDRFLEEALELVQALDYTAERAHKLVEYTFGRPKGEGAQEVGGVSVTLAVLCSIAGINQLTAAELELGRCWENMPKIRAKQADKTAHGVAGSPLPGASA